MKRTLACLAWLGLLAACGGSTQGKPTTPGRTELVVDEATVVRGRRPLREGELPPLPQALPHTSAAFQRGHALALPLLAAVGPGAPTALDDASYRAWSAQAFQAWLSARVSAAQAATDALGAVRDGPATEHVPAAALLGLVFARTHAQLLAVPPPASVSADAKLLRIYQSQLNVNAERWAQQATAAFEHCARAATREADLALGLWLELCQTELQSLQQAAERARVLAEVVAAEREADRIAAEGPRPDGPPICWGPPTAPAGTAVSAVSPEAPHPTAAAPATAAQGAIAPQAAPARSAAKSPCARAPHTVADDAGLALSPRDQRYGVRDAASGVRVWAALADNATMDASPLLERSTHAALGACYAHNVSGRKAVTVAVHATLSVDANGRARSVTLTPEPSDAAAPPDEALSRCLRRVLQRVPFDCSPTGQPTQASVLFCMRKD